MTISQGNHFMTQNTALKVHSAVNGKLIGYITSDDFKANKYMRATKDGTKIYVCEFIPVGK